MFNSVALELKKNGFYAAAVTMSSPNCCNTFVTCRFSLSQ